MATPLLLKLDDLLQRMKPEPQDEAFDMLPDEQGHVVIAGFGRVGQIIARLLKAKGIPFMALDASPKQVDLVKRFGNESYYGDASRLDILRAAQVDQAVAFVLTVSDVEASIKAATTVRKHFPDVPIIARARNRQHAHRLMDLGVDIIHRETFLSSLELAKEALRTAGISESEARQSVETFRQYDRQRLYDDYKHYTDQEKLTNRAKAAQQELADLLARDADVLEQDKDEAAE